MTMNQTPLISSVAKAIDEKMRDPLFAPIHESQVQAPISVEQVRILLAYIAELKAAAPYRSSSPLRLWSKDPTSEINVERKVR